MSFLCICWCDIGMERGAGEDRSRLALWPQIHSPLFARIRIKDQGSPLFARIRQKTKYRICVIRTVLSSPGSDETNYQTHVTVMVKKGYFICDLCWYLSGLLISGHKVCRSENHLAAPKNRRLTNSLIKGKSSPFLQDIQLGRYK